MFYQTSMYYVYVMYTTKRDIINSSPFITITHNHKSINTRNIIVHIYFILITIDYYIIYKKLK